MPVVHVRDIDMYYELHGTGETIVLIGGVGNDITEWEWLTLWCAQTHRVLTFDNRGAGRTDKPKVPYSIEMMAADTDALMGELGITQATVLGVSMGGQIALELALEHPDRVARLILVSTSATARPDNGPTRTEMVSIVGSLFFRGKYPQPHYAQSRQRQAARVYDSMDRLDEIHAPTTIMHGRNDMIAPLRHAEAIRHGIEGSEMITFRSGHYFFMRKERKWFLASVAGVLDAAQTVPAP